MLRPNCSTTSSLNLTPMSLCLHKHTQTHTGRFTYMCKNVSESLLCFLIVKENKLLVYKGTTVSSASYFSQVVSCFLNQMLLRCQTDVCGDCLSGHHFLICTPLFISYTMIHRLISHMTMRSYKTKKNRGHIWEKGCSSCHANHDSHLQIIDVKGS